MVGGSLEISTRDENVCNSIGRSVVAKIATFIDSCWHVRCSEQGRVLLICCLCIGLVYTISAQTTDNPTAGDNPNTISGTQPVDPHSRLDSVATTISPDKLTKSEIGATADAVFAIPHFGLIQQIPASVIAFVKQRFAAAEEAYWNGQHDGIQDKDIVGALNKVVAQLNLPEYAKTSQSQVRQLRMILLQMNPHFMELMIAKESPTGEPTAISDTMSPLQAYHLMLTLIDQKFITRSYQVTPSEWENRSSQSSSPVQPAARPTQPHISTNWDNPRIFEMQDRLRQGLSSLSDAQGVETLIQTLNALGIN